MILENDNKGYTEDHKESLALKAMIGFGVGEVLGGFVLGLISDWIGMKATSFVNVAIILSMIGVTVVNILQLEYNWVAYLMCFMWGF